MENNNSKLPVEIEEEKKEKWFKRKKIIAVENVLKKYSVWLAPKDPLRPEGYNFIFTHSAVPGAKKLDSSSWYFFLGEFDEHIKKMKKDVKRLKLKNVIFKKHRFSSMHT